MMMLLICLQSTIVWQGCLPSKNSTEVSCLKGCTCHVDFVLLSNCVWCWPGWGTLKDNAEQIGHAIKHLGCRPSLSVMLQAVESFFHLALPRKHEVCSDVSATSNIWACIIEHTFLWGSLSVCGCLFRLLCGPGLRAKFHAKAMMKLVFSFSRIAKCLSCITCGIMWLCLCHFWEWLVPCICGFGFSWPRRGHRPRDKRIRLIYELSGMSIPGNCCTCQYIVLVLVLWICLQVLAKMLPPSRALMMTVRLITHLTWKCLVWIWFLVNLCLCSFMYKHCCTD